MILSFLVFVCSLLGIGTLFALKECEVRRGVEKKSVWRQWLDAQALQIKELLGAAFADLRKIPPELVYLGRLLLREIVLGAARGARFFERQMHRAAEFISYKRRFERRAPRSEFLSKIAEHKNGNGGAQATAASPEPETQDQVSGSVARGDTNP